MPNTDDNFELVLPTIPDQATQLLPDPSLLNFYIDLENRTYWLCDEINRYTFDLVQYIIRWNRDDKDIPVEDRKPIKIIIDCDGGYVSVSETLANVIALSKTPIHGLALGQVASGASVVYLACHKKYALSNTCFVLHKGSCDGVGGSFDEIQAFMKDYEKQIGRLLAFYETHTSFSHDEIEAHMKSDWYVRLPLAQEKGLVDEVLTDLNAFL